MTATPRTPHFTHDQLQYLGKLMDYRLRGSVHEDSDHLDAGLKPQKIAPGSTGQVLVGSGSAAVWSSTVGAQLIIGSDALGRMRIGTYTPDPTYASLGHDTNMAAAPQNYALAVGKIGTDPNIYLQHQAGGVVKFGQPSLQRLSMGVWPASSSYGFIGAANLDQTVPNNYALLSDSASTLVSAPSGSVYIRKANADRLTVGNSVAVAPGIDFTPNARTCNMIVNTTQSITAGTWTTPDFNNADQSNGAMCTADLTRNILYLNRAGFYLIGCQAMWAASTGDTVIGCRIRHSGGAVFAASMGNGKGNTQGFQQNIVCVSRGFSFAAGTWITMDVLWNLPAGGGGTYTVGAFQSPYDTVLSATYLGDSA